MNNGKPLQFRDAMDILCYSRADVARDLGISHERVSHLAYRTPLRDETRIRAVKRLLPLLKERRYLLNEVIMELESSL